MDESVLGRIKDAVEALVLGKEKDIEGRLQEIGKILLESEIILSSKENSMTIRPCWVEAYYWNPEQKWFDGYCHLNGAQKFKSDDGGCHLYIHHKKLPGSEKDYRNGLDLVISVKEGVCLSFLLKFGYVDDEPMKQSEIGNEVRKRFQPKGFDCANVSVFIDPQKALPKPEIENTRRDGLDGLPRARRDYKKKCCKELSELRKHECDQLAVFDKNIFPSSEYPKRRS